MLGPGILSGTFVGVALVFFLIAAVIGACKGGCGGCFLFAAVTLVVIAAVVLMSLA